MKIHRSKDYIHLDFTGAEAAWLLEELETVPRGSKFPKIRQMCEGLRNSLTLNAAMAPPKMGRPKQEAAERSIAAAELGREGGLKGGPARATALSAEERSNIARRVAEVRWGLSPQSPPFEIETTAPWDADEGDP